MQSTTVAAAIVKYAKQQALPVNVANAPASPSRWYVKP
ncbi:hypothetical protein C4K18_4726 [Pseudomonas chlororaphis subsp. aurantiaca]|nr:hypothetical protein C4K18_4726 [Pseudomonas chlororaphis subsp. aurantiaca]